MQYLKKLADADHTVVLTIHQPEAAIWNLIDDLVLLSEGYTLYYGPTEQVRSLIPLPSKCARSFPALSNMSELSNTAWAISPLLCPWGTDDHPFNVQLSPT